MSQNKNTKEVLTRFETKNSKLCHKKLRKSGPTNVKDRKSSYQILIDPLLYQPTRSDISFIASALSQFNWNFSKEH